MSKRSINVTCPNCEHTHVVEVDMDELALDPSEREYTLKQVERILNLSRATLKRYIYQGILEAHKSGSGEGGSPWMVSAEAIRDFKRRRATS